MRFALRSKTKLKGAKGDAFYKLLRDSLDKHAEDNEEIKEFCQIKGRTSFLVRSIKNKSKHFQFVVIRQLYDVMVVAYYDTHESKSIIPNKTKVV